jgi:RNA polymerase sigma-70 factor (ECF subfamily)
MLYNKSETLIKTHTVEQSTQSENVFTGLVNKHLDEIYNFAYHMVFDYDEANDIAQKTFISLHKNFLKLDLNESIRPWLYKVARNNALDYLKKHKAVQFSEVEEEVVLEVPSSDPSLEAKMDDTLFMEKVRESMKELPVAMKEVLLMKYFEDLTFEQIADIQDLPVNTVKSNFYRGKQKLYKIINQ